MALQDVVFQQLFGYGSKDLYHLLEGNWSCDFHLVEKQDRLCFHNIILDEKQAQSYQYQDWTCRPPPSPPPSMVPAPHLEQQPNIPNNAIIPEEYSQHVQKQNSSSTRPKRRCSKTKKNTEEEIENQRITHITIERNRRKQMNHYLSALRALMPDTYVPKGDQASIVGGAINYVKELEQWLQALRGQKQINQALETGLSSPFGKFFTFPQYSTNSSTATMDEEPSAENQSALTHHDIEVSMVENHANLKIRCKKRPKQLLKLVSGLQSLSLTILHLNVTTVDQIVLYSLSIKLEDDCKVTSVEEIAAAVNQMLGKIQEEGLQNLTL